MKIKIGNKYFKYFNGFAVSQKLDSVASTFSFVVRYNSEDAESRIMFKPLSYPDVEIYTDEDKLLLTGTIVSHDFNSDKNPELVQVSGYSKGGILEDCTIPIANYPLENIKGNLKEISSKLLSIYGLSLIVDKSAAKDCSFNYRKAIAEPTETIKEFLSKMASKRNIIMSNDVRGNIIYYKPDTKALSKFSFNQRNTLNCSLSVDGQGMHSQISVIRQPSHENTGVSSNDTLNNGLVKKKRVIVKKMSSGEDTNTSRAVDNALATELKALTVTIKIKNWMENLICGDIVDLHNHEIYFFTKIKLIISEIEYQQNSKEKTMVLKCLLPEAYSGEIPKNIFDYDKFE